MKKYMKLIVVIVIIVLFVWFLVLKPGYTFKKYEGIVTDAAKRYYEINSSHLPTGKRVATVSLQDLFTGSYIKEDLYIPYTKQPCSVTDSWVKVVRKDGDYKYITYLKCGVLESQVDHTGPQITLKGDDKITVERYSKFEDPGVEKVVDKGDGIIDTKDVKISGEVDTSKVNSYTIKYSVTDSLGNKSEVSRKVIVEENLGQTIKNKIKSGYFVEGNADNNYIRLSNMIFRIIKLDGNDNVIAVSDQDIVNINYSKIDKWFDEYYIKQFNKKSKKYLVKNKYCKDTVDTKDTKNCNNFTEERYFYIPNVVDINNTKNDKGNTYLLPITMSWVASTNEKPYSTKNFLVKVDDNDYQLAGKTDNYGLRPVITINGKSKIMSGDGSEADPYSFDEVKSGRGGEKINTRYVGEYIRYSGYLWRIIDTPKDGTTKVIMMDTVLESDEEFIRLAYPSDNIYNPNEKGNVGYYINNKISEFLSTSYFVNHKMKVKLYNKDIVYGEESSTKEYKVKLAAPDMYEMFSAGLPITDGGYSYWMTNSTTDGGKCAVIGDNNSVINEKIYNSSRFGVRLVGYLHESVLINSGKGTETDPYVITK